MLARGFGKRSADGVNDRQQVEDPNEAPEELTFNGVYDETLDQPPIKRKTSPLDILREYYRRLGWS